MKNVIFAFDFSMNKPAMCCLINDKVSFYVWPSTIDSQTSVALQDAGIHVFNRELPPMKDGQFNEHTLICEHVTRAVNLAGLITDKICELLEENKIEDKDNIIIANEGFAFGSKGDATLDLSGYKYILMHALMSKGFTNFKTYAPTTIKATAGCCKKGLGKEAMIDKLKEESYDIHPFFRLLATNNMFFRKKKNYMLCIDDLADSYWCLRTVIKKENLNTFLSE